MKKIIWIIFILIILLLILFLGVLPGLNINGFEPLREFWLNLFR